MSQSAKNEWWRGGVIYQIYPRSYKDTNGDGIGDLPGIAEKLEYIASLGVEGIWLSPFFKSPMKDYGYDVSDYCDVDPMFGTLDEFRKLLDKAHALDLKIIIDLVLSHTSDQHPWFTESRSSRDNPKADWYVWADPKPDGAPPNNWQSVFGGPSWDYDVRRGQYYLHNFLPSQPDLNLYNAEVKAALFDAARFWLDMGVDGFRLDAVPHYFHQPGLEDNPPKPNPKPANFNIAFPTPFTMQLHVNDVALEPGFAFAEEFRALLDEYPGRMAVAEVGIEDGIAAAAAYTDGPERLHTAYNFSLISGHELSAKRIRESVLHFLNQPGDSWPSWAFSNHDVTRVASRWHPEKNKYGHGYSHAPRLSRLLVALLCTLKGTIFMYQGEELGLPEAEIPYDRIQDPWGKYLYPQWQGRDGSRTPIPWEKAGTQAGFSSAEPWLPIPAEHCRLAVDAQEDEPDSLLHFTRDFLAWRKGQPALVTGLIEFVGHEDNDKLLSYIRREGDQAIICLFNLADKEQSVTPDGGMISKHLKGDGVPEGGNGVRLPPYGFYFGIIES